MLLAVLKGRDTELGEKQRGRTRFGQESLGKLLVGFPLNEEMEQQTEV